MLTPPPEHAGNTFNKSDRRGTGIKLQGHSWVTSHSGISIVWPTPITKTINETELQPILCVAYTLLSYFILFVSRRWMSAKDLSTV